MSGAVYIEIQYAGLEKGQSFLGVQTNVLHFHIKTSFFHKPLFLMYREEVNIQAVILIDSWLLLLLNPCQLMRASPLIPRYRTAPQSGFLDDYFVVNDSEMTK